MRVSETLSECGDIGSAWQRRLHQKGLVAECRAALQSPSVFLICGAQQLFRTPPPSPRSPPIPVCIGGVIDLPLRQHALCITPRSPAVDLEWRHYFSPFCFHLKNNTFKLGHGSNKWSLIITLI